MLRAVLWLSAALVLPLLAANPYLGEGRAHYDALRFDEAAQQLQLACLVPANTIEERRLACDLWARAAAALGRERESERAYSQLLAADPDAPEPVGVAPKIREAYLNAKRSLPVRGDTRASREGAGDSRQELPVDEAVSADGAMGEHDSTTARKGPAWPAWALTAISVTAAAMGTGYAVAASADSRRAGAASFASETRDFDERAHENAVAANWLIGGALLGGAAAAVVFVTW